MHTVSMADFNVGDPNMIYMDSTWRHFDFSEIFDLDFDDLMASTNKEDGIKEIKNKLECNPEPSTSQMSTSRFKKLTEEEL